MIINRKEVGFRTKCTLMLIEQAILMLLVYCRLTYKSPYMLSDDQLYSATSSSFFWALGLVGLMALINLRLVMCYKEFQTVKSGDRLKSSSRLFLYLMSFLSTILHEVLAILLQIYIAIIFYSPSSSQESGGMVLVICAALLQLQLVMWQFVDKLLINMQFPSQQLITARASNQPFVLEYLSLIRGVITSYLSLKPGQSGGTESVLYLFILTLLGVYGQFYLASTTQAYFSKVMRRAAVFINSIGCAFTLSILLLALAESTSLVKTFSLSYLAVVGISFLIKRKWEKAILSRLIAVKIEDLDQTRDSLFIQQAMQLLWEQIESSSECQAEKRVINQLIIKHEEDLHNEDIISYMEVISLLVAGDNFEEPDSAQIVDQDKGYESASQSFYLAQSLLNLNQYLNSEKMTNQEQSEFQEESIQSAREQRSLRKLRTTGSENKSGISCRRFNTQIESGINGGTIEHKKQLLNDVFVKDTVSRNQNLKVKKGIDYEGRGLISHVVKLLNQTKEGLITLEQAIKLVKIRFLYDLLQGKWGRHFPHNTQLMFFRAQLGIEYLENKYLALTTVAGISQQAYRRGYIEQIQDHISEAYFVGQCESDELLGGMHVEISSYLNESLHIERIMQSLGRSADLIGQFWSLYGQEELTPQQFKIFNSISERIPVLLSEIRKTSRALEEASMAHQVYKSDLLYVSISHFYSIVLRDSQLGHRVLAKYESLMGTKNSGEGGALFAKTAFNEEGEEEIGVMVVDGRFDLFGKVIFGNKCLIQALGYKNAKDVTSMTVHRLMPRCVAEVHNIFWKGFQQVGEPKVLDKLRYLFVKDADKHISPFKCFIKFQYTPHFGYCFIGLFSKPQHIIFNSADNPLDLDETCQLICNKQGQILECSASAHPILRLTPAIIEGLQSQLTEGINLTLLNPHCLHLKEIDFDQGNCIHFKQLKLNLGPLYKCIEYLEHNEERMQENSIESTPLFSSESSSFKSCSSYNANNLFQTQISGVNPFSPGDAQVNSEESEETLKVQLKIIKETYSLGAQVPPLELYYVLISEQIYIPVDDHQSVFNGIQQTLKDSNSAEVLGRPSNLGRQIAFQEDNIGGGYNNMFQNTFGNKKGSRQDSLRQGGDDMLDLRDMGSQCSRVESVTSDSTVRLMEEGIEEQNQPRVLTYLRVCITVLACSLLILAVIQYYLNQRSLAELRVNQSIIVKCAQSEEYITQLNLMTRSYLNIMIGLEDDNSSLIPDSSLRMRAQAFTLIDLIRENVKELQQFFNAEDKPQVKTVIFNLLQNTTIESREVLRFYSVNLWLVRLEELYSYQRVNSSIGTFQDQNLTSASVFDSLVFLVQVNGRRNVIAIFSGLIQDEQTLAESTLRQNMVANYVLLILSSLLTLAGLVLILYYIYGLLNFKLTVFTLFQSVMSPEQIDLHAKGAKCFQDYVSTGSEITLVEHQQRVNVYKQAVGTYKPDNETTALKRAKSQYYPPDEPLFQKKKAVAAIIEKPKLGDINRRKSMLKRQSVFVREEHFLGLLAPPSSMQTKAQQQLIELRKLYGGVTDAKQNGATPRLSIQSKGGLKNQAPQDSEPSQPNEEQEQDESPRKLGEEINHNVKQSIPSKQEKMSLITQYNSLRTRLAWRYVPLITLLSGIFIIYFLIQEFLSMKEQSVIQGDGQSLKVLLGGMKCQEEFIDNVREIHVSNNTQYALSPGASLSLVPNIPFSESRLNQTFSSCLQTNKQAQSWLQIALGGEYFLSPSSNPMCSLAVTPYDQDVCSHIYSGVFQQGILQATSLFLQDMMYSYIRFATQYPQISRQELVADYLNCPLMLEMIDAETFFMSPYLRRHYQKVIDAVFEAERASSNNTAILIAFCIFICILVLLYLVLEFGLLALCNRWFWRAFMMVQLLPRDDMDKPTVKRINELVKNN